MALANEPRVGKANPPDRSWAIRTRFADPPPGEPFATVSVWAKHGDRIARRRLWTSPALADAVYRPGVAQGARLERTTWRRGIAPRQASWTNVPARPRPPWPRLARIIK